MAEHDFMPLDGWDHVELWVGNAKQAAFFYEHALGFTRTAYAGPETGVRDRASYVLEQGEVRLVVTSGTARGLGDRALRRRHGDGARDIALRVPDAREAYRRRSSAARPDSASRTWAEDETGASSSRRSRLRRRRPHVRQPRRLRRFVPARLRRAAVGERRRPGGSVGLANIDHVVGNVELGRMNHWVEFYERVFGMTEMIHFSDEDISTEYSALMSKVMTDGQGKIKFPINEPAEGKRKSQIEEYLEYNHGPGVQHIALASSNIVARSRRCRSGG